MLSKKISKPDTRLKSDFVDASLDTCFCPQPHSAVPGYSLYYNVIHTPYRDDVIVCNHLIHLKMLLGNNNALTSGAGKQTIHNVQLFLLGAERANLRKENIMR